MWTWTGDVFHDPDDPSGIPGSRTSLTRSPLLGLLSHPPWRVRTGSLRFSFEAFTLLPCDGDFGCYL